MRTQKLGSLMINFGDRFQIQVSKPSVKATRELHPRANSRPALALASALLFVSFVIQQPR